MKIVLYIIIFFLLGSTSSACEKEDISIKITNCNITNTDVVIQLLISNNSKDTVRTYAPQISDICNNILKINFKSTSLAKYDYTFFPCEWIADIDLIKLNEANSILLPPGNTYQQELTINKNDIAPLKRNNTYKVQVEWLFEDINFNSDDVFNNNIKSNEFKFDY